MAVVQRRKPEDRPRMGAPAGNIPRPAMVVPQGPELDERLLDDIAARIQKFVVLPRPHRTYGLILATYVVHTWTWDVSHVTPYLYVNGPMESGKTLLLENLQTLVKNPFKADSITAAAMQQVMASKKPTLILDELDTQWSGTRNEPLRCAVNAGYRRGGTVVRQRGYEVQELDVFGPKILGGIMNGYMPPTITSRSLPIVMAPKQADDRVERFVFHRELQSGEREALLQRIWQFRTDFMDEVALHRPFAIRGIGDRQNEIAEPLLQIATVFDRQDELGDALQSAFAAAKGGPTSPMQRLLKRIRDVFRGDEQAVFAETLCGALGGGCRQPEALEAILETVGIRSRDVRIGGHVERGYKRSDLEPVWAEYL